jgi:acetyltransferase-like isoleucine patch superfamily enzyme
VKIDYDWYPGDVPDAVRLGRDVYIDSAYSFAAFQSGVSDAMTLGDATGAYDRSAFIFGPRGRIVVGDFTCLNACYLICEREITIGSFCMFAWGATLTDSWVHAGDTVKRRRAAINRANDADCFSFPHTSNPDPVHVEDNVWIGFDSVVMPGVTVGRGAIIGSKSIVDRDVEPYTIVVGDPAAAVRKLNPNDTDDVRRQAIAGFIKD